MTSGAAREMSLDEWCATLGEGHRARRELAELKAGRVTHPTPWRQGRRVPRNIYDADDNPIMMAPDDETARATVAAVNGDRQETDRLETLHIRAESFQLQSEYVLLQTQRELASAQAANECFHSAAAHAEACRALAVELLERLFNNDDFGDEFEGDPSLVEDIRVYLYGKGGDELPLRPCGGEGSESHNLKKSTDSP